MARYIDADALIEDIQETICAKCDICDGIKCKSCGMDDTLDFLENAPTANVVPKSEVAKEIIKDLVDLVDRKERLQQRYDETFYYVNSDDLTDFIAELKKKYTGDGE